MLELQLQKKIERLLCYAATNKTKTKNKQNVFPCVCLPVINIDWNNNTKRACDKKGGELTLNRLVVEWGSTSI